MTTPHVDGLDRPSRRIGLILVLGTLMVMLDLTVVTVAIPHLTAEFGATLSTVQWVTGAYTLALVAVMPLSAWATARFGGRRVYCTALLVFVTGSLLAAVAPTIGSLIAFRAIQGIGGGMLQPVGMAIALQAVPEAARGRMMALLGLPVLIGPVLGPSLGGLLVDHATWRLMFAINVPIGLVAIALALRHFPSPAGTLVRRSIDLRAVAALSPGGAFLVFGLARTGDSDQVLSSSIIVPVGIGVALLGYFVVRSLRSDRPVLDLRLLRIPNLRGGLVVLLFFAGGYFGSMLILPIYVQAVRGDTATTAGLLYVVPALATGTTLQIATRVADRIDPRRVIVVGVALSVVAMVLMAAVLDATTPYPLIIGILTLMGIGVGATLMPTMTAATRALEGADTAGGTTILATGTQFANAVVAAIVTAVLAGLINARAAVAGEGVAGAMRMTPDARRAAAESLASAVADTYRVTAVLFALALLAVLVLMPGRTARTRPGAGAEKRTAPVSLGPPSPEPSHCAGPAGSSSPAGDR